MKLQHDEYFAIIRFDTDQNRFLERQREIGCIRPWCRNFNCQAEKQDAKRMFLLPDLTPIRDDETHQYGYFCRECGSPLTYYFRVRSWEEAAAQARPREAVVCVQKFHWAGRQIFLNLILLIM